MFGKSIIGKVICVVICFSTTSIIAQITPAEYSNLQSQFSSLHGPQIVFPVAGKTNDDVESTFGPRIQHSTGLYDFHRGIDVDGTEGDDILAITNGVFWEHRTFSRGGLTVILRHDFDAPVSLNGNSYDHYYTYYMHLFDDDVQGNGTGTLDVINGWIPEKTNPGLGTSISAGSHIAELGNSGSSGGTPYADHLHMEVRVGTTNSLIYQTDNPHTTQHGFDPHVHPMLFFEPPATGSPENSPTLTAAGALRGNEDFVATWRNDDRSPLLNRIEVFLRDSDNAVQIDSHVLDFNLREGFDASEESLLDTQDLLKPYIDPVSFSDSSTAFRSNIVIPETWLNSANTDFTLEIRALDIWGNVTSLQIASVPEPTCGFLTALLLIAGGCSRRRR